MVPGTTIQPALQIQRLFALLGFDIDHHVADRGVGLQILRGDVDPLLPKRSR